MRRVHDVTPPLLAVLALLLTSSGCSDTPTTPPATCDSQTATTPASWAPWQVSATLTPDSTASPEAVPTVQAIASVPYPYHSGDDPAAPRVWRCAGYTMLNLVLTQPDQPSGTPVSATLPRTPCTGDRVTSESGECALRLVERTSWCAKDLGGGQEAGFDGWWVNVTAAEAGTYTWTRDITWTRYPRQATNSTTAPPPIERSGEATVTATLAP
ncbi:hypothetical protein OG218_00335 [Kineococcus sp. NBC_00420]|uniref:hypothetical protein n=1 Tax=Kineococcus sp. NBC_00420 TaxID=2903564 RepID=UPI002E1C3F2E